MHSLGGLPILEREREGEREREVGKKREVNNPAHLESAEGK